MADNNKTNVWTYVILAVLGLILISCTCSPIAESFSNMYRYVKYNNVPDYSTNSLADSLWTGKLATDCYDKSIKDCTKYTNCGVCESGGIKTCVPGDEEGPMFKEGCDTWGFVNYRDGTNYRDTYNPYYSANDYKGEYTTSLPWSHVYADYEYWAPGPTSRVLY